MHEAWNTLLPTAQPAMSLLSTVMDPLSNAVTVTPPRVAKVQLPEVHIRSKKPLPTHMKGDGGGSGGAGCCACVVCVCGGL